MVGRLSRVDRWMQHRPIAGEHGLHRCRRRQKGRRYRLADRRRSQAVRTPKERYVALRPGGFPLPTATMAPSGRWESGVGKRWSSSRLSGVGDNASIPPAVGFIPPRGRLPRPLRTAPHRVGRKTGSMPSCGQRRRPSSRKQLRPALPTITRDDDPCGGARTGDPQFRRPVPATSWSPDHG